jgi:adenylate cyclase
MPAVDVERPAAPSSASDRLPAGQAAHRQPAPDEVPAADSPWARPLRLHLSIVIVLLLVSISVPLMWLTYQQGTRSAIAAGDQQMRLLSEHAIDRYRSIFSDGYSAIGMTSVSLALLNAPPADLQVKTDFLMKALSSSSYIDGIYVGYPTGDFVHAVNVARNPKWREVLAAPEGTVTAFRTIVDSGPSGRLSTWRFLDKDGSTITERTSKDVTYDPRRRPWYKAAANGTEVIAVVPYVTATTRSLGLTLATPMSKDHAVVVGADVLLETLSSLLAKEAVSAHARGYVFDDQKRIIVHSDRAMMDLILENLAGGPRGKPAALSLPDPVLDAVRVLLDAKGDQPEGTVSFLVDGQPYRAEISSVGFSGLVEGNTVVIAAPLSDFTGASVRLLQKALLISGILLLAGIVAALLIARLVSNSLSSLTADARQIGDLEFNQQSAIQSHIAEINTLAGALGSARDAIRTFALYVPRELVRRIVASGQAAAGSAVRQDVTIIFTDIRDFTTISERHSPEEVVSLLSGYFQLMNDIVEAHKGVIVQYLGDSIYAMWNAPTPDPEHVDDGCRCALALKAGVDEYNERNRAQGMPELITRYGVHTGAAVVGSVGALTRRQYTAMGDTVNVASRLEGLNKEFGTTILASEAVKARADKSFHFRPLGLTRAKGRAEQVEVFELVGTS